MRELLKDVLSEKGRSQVWIMQQLATKGIERSTSTLSQYCNGYKKPRDRYVLLVLAELLECGIERIENCFINAKSE